MTYNGWYMIAVAVGAGLGNYFWVDQVKEVYHATKIIIKHTKVSFIMMI